MAEDGVHIHRRQHSLAFALPIELSHARNRLGDVADRTLDRFELAGSSPRYGWPVVVAGAFAALAGLRLAGLSHDERLRDGPAELVHLSVEVNDPDQAPFVEKSIEGLTTEGLLGLGMAVLVILVFLLSIRSTVVTAVSIPLSVIAALIGLLRAYIASDAARLVREGIRLVMLGRRDRLPANLLQAQRDYFGARTYERTDKPGIFHTDWIRERREPTKK